MNNLYSKRQKLLRGEVPDVYTYDGIPGPLRVQIVHIWGEAIGDSESHYHGPDELFTEIERILCKEYGVFSLTKQREGSRSAVTNFFLRSSAIDQCLDVVELVFRVIDRIVRNRYGEFFNSRTGPDEAIAELNQRFREHGVGYQFVNGEIIRVDSQLVHQDVVLPALRLLDQPYLSGANDEFMSAHEHYRHQRFKECLNDCLKAFESTMKAICAKRKWAYAPNATAKQLIDVCIQNGLFPAFTESHLSGLRVTLESGVPTVRNKLSGHGQGSIPKEVPEELASYALHLTAVSILLLGNCERSLR